MRQNTINAPTGLRGLEQVQKTLKRIDLYENSITGKGLAAFGLMKKNNNENFLFSFPSLTYLDISFNPIRSLPSSYSPSININNDNNKNDNNNNNDKEGNKDGNDNKDQKEDDNKEGDDDKNEVKEEEKKEDEEEEGIEYVDREGGPLSAFPNLIHIYFVNCKLNSVPPVSTLRHLKTLEVLLLLLFPYSLQFIIFIY